MDEVAISVQDVNKTFKLPHEKQGSIKGLFVNLFRGHRTYERQKVLKKVSLEIKKGDFFGVVGRNGGGKSTLLKLLAGVYTPDSGHIQVNGKLTPFIELGVGFNPELTGRENVYLNGALLGFSNKEMSVMYDDIVAFAELRKFMDQKLKNYSSGMQVRLAFSIAIRAQTDILLLDEVLAVGDAAFQQKCFDYFEKLKAEKKTVILVTHDMGAIKRFCNRAAYIKNGKIIHEGTPTEVADIYVENNIDHSNQGEDLSLPEGYTIDAKITAEDTKSLTLSVKYQAKKNTPVYVGIAVVKDGVSIGELTTSLDVPLKGKGSVSYELDKTQFNSGLYVVGGVSLFKLENRELVAASKKKNSFVIKGNDMRRGGALKLADNWSYKND